MGFQCLDLTSLGGRGALSRRRWLRLTFGRVQDLIVLVQLLGQEVHFSQGYDERYNHAQQDAKAERQRAHHQIDAEKPNVKPAATEKMNCTTAMICLLRLLTEREGKNDFKRADLTSWAYSLTLIADSVLWIVFQAGVHILGHFEVIPILLLCAKTLAARF